MGSGSMGSLFRSQESPRVAGLQSPLSEVSFKPSEGENGEASNGHHAGNGLSYVTECHEFISSLCFGIVNVGNLRTLVKRENTLFSTVPVGRPVPAAGLTAMRPGGA